jgi:phage shock protein E
MPWKHLSSNQKTMFGLKKLFGTKPDLKAIKENGAIILDVRTAGEFKTGHIPGSLNIAVDHVASSAAELKKKNKPVITCCRSGARSAVAEAILKNAGIEVYNGGVWNELMKELS